MICCLDVDYRPSACAAAAVSFRAFSDALAVHETTYLHPEPPEDYQPGQFYRRELPHLLAVLQRLPAPPELLVIDGFVWLEQDTPGLGAHLHRALGGATPVVGVAKRPYRKATSATAVLRGTSRAPLWVSAVGYEVSLAAAAVAAMHGEHRIPTLLQRVDRLARDAR
jgi:deoxyribonuclease V